MESPRRHTTIPEGARLVLKPCGYIIRRSSRADDVSIVNGARASFAKHKSSLGPEDIRTPEEAEALNRDPQRIASQGGKEVLPGLIYRLLGAGHETPCEQHGLLLSIEGAPPSLRNVVPDEIDARLEGSLLHFPWTLNLRHAMTLHRRALRMGDPDLLSLSSAILVRFRQAGVEHGTEAFARSLGVPWSSIEEGAKGGLEKVRIVANPPSEREILPLLRAHLPAAEELDEEALLDIVYDRHPHLLNLWVFTWQIRAILHVFWDLVRHRKSSPNGESGRYSILYDEWIELSPEEVRTQVGSPLSYERGQAPWDVALEFIRDLEEHNSRGVELYRKWLQKGIAREQCSWFETLSKFRTFVWTFRGLGLLNMLALRNHPTALRELRLYAREMEEDVRQEAPLLHALFERRGRRAP